MVPLARRYWCSRVSPAFTVQMDLVSHLISLDLGVWDWKSWSRGPALLPHLMDIMPIFLNPCRRYTDDLVSNSFSENYSYTVGVAGWTHSWVLGWYITLIPAAPATLLPALAPAGSSGHKQPLLPSSHEPQATHQPSDHSCSSSSFFTLAETLVSPSLQLKIVIAALIN